MLADLQDAMQSATASSTIPKGRLVVRLIATGAGHSPVLGVIEAFLKERPQVENKTRFTDRYIDLPFEGVDLAISSERFRTLGCSHAKSASRP